MNVTADRNAFKYIESWSDRQALLVLIKGSNKIEPFFKALYFEEWELHPLRIWTEKSLPN